MTRPAGDAMSEAGPSSAFQTDDSRPAAVDVADHWDCREISPESVRGHTADAGPSRAVHTDNSHAAAIDVVDQTEVLRPASRPHVSESLLGDVTATSEGPGDDGAVGPLTVHQDDDTTPRLNDISDGQTNSEHELSVRPCPADCDETTWYTRRHDNATDDCHACCQQ